MSHTTHTHTWEGRRLWRGRPLKLLSHFTKIREGENVRVSVCVFPMGETVDERIRFSSEGSAHCRDERSKSHFVRVAHWRQAGCCDRTSAVAAGSARATRRNHDALHSDVAIVVFHQLPPLCWAGPTHCTDTSTPLLLLSSSSILNFFFFTRFAQGAI